MYVYVCTNHVHHHCVNHVCVCVCMYVAAAWVTTYDRPSILGLPSML